MHPELPVTNRGLVKCNNPVPRLVDGVAGLRLLTTLGVNTDGSDTIRSAGPVMPHTFQALRIDWGGGGGDFTLGQSGAATKS